MRIFSVVAISGSVGACEIGFEHRPNGECVDIDECSTGTHSCEFPFSCHNLPGTFGCDLGQARKDLKCGISGDFGTCSTLPWDDSGLKFPCCNTKHSECGNSPKHCFCKDCINYADLESAYKMSQDNIIQSQYDDNIFGQLEQNKDFIINWALTHLTSSTWLQEIVRRSNWQTEELINFFELSKCQPDNRLREPVPKHLASQIAMLQVQGKYTTIFSPVIDYYLSQCSSAKNAILKHKMQKISSLILKACAQLSVECPQFRKHSVPNVQTKPESSSSIARARPKFDLNYSNLRPQAVNSRPYPGNSRPSYYQKSPSSNLAFSGIKNIQSGPGFTTLYKRVADGTYKIWRVLGNE